MESSEKAVIVYARRNYKRIASGMIVMLNVVNITLDDDSHSSED